MAIQQCPSCGELVDDTSVEYCPFCGETIPEDGIAV